MTGAGAGQALHSLAVSMFPGLLQELLTDWDTWHRTRAGSIEAALRIQQEAPMLRLLLEWEAWYRAGAQDNGTSSRVLNDVAVLEGANRGATTRWRSCSLELSTCHRYGRFPTCQRRTSPSPTSRGRTAVTAGRLWGLPRLRVLISPCSAVQRRAAAPSGRLARVPFSPVEREHRRLKTLRSDEP
jgi:hypothetical protein